MQIQATFTIGLMFLSLVLSLTEIPVMRFGLPLGPCPPVAAVCMLIAISYNDKVIIDREVEIGLPHEEKACPKRFRA
jgi:hypothetical protein